MRRQLNKYKIGDYVIFENPSKSCAYNSFYVKGKCYKIGEIDKTNDVLMCEKDVYFYPHEIRLANEIEKLSYY